MDAVTASTAADHLYAHRRLVGGQERRRDVWLRDVRAAALALPEQMCAALPLARDARGKALDAADFDAVLDQVADTLALTALDPCPALAAVAVYHGLYHGPESITASADGLVVSMVRPDAERRDYRLRAWHSEGLVQVRAAWTVAIPTPVHLERSSSRTEGTLNAAFEPHGSAREVLAALFSTWRP